MPLSQLAIINETACIGCTRCIDACPVDAIIGAAQHMHTVLQAQCIGCALCIPPCPVKCIQMIDGEILTPSQRQNRVLLAKKNVAARKTRLRREAADKALEDKKQTSQDLKTALRDAIARAKQKHVRWESIS